MDWSHLVILDLCMPGNITVVLLLSRIFQIQNASTHYFADVYCPLLIIFLSASWFPAFCIHKETIAV